MRCCKMLWSLPVLVLAQIASAQTGVDLTGRWRINGNGFPGDLVLQQNADGSVSGTMYGDRVAGYVAGGARQVVLLRGPVNAPDQVYIAEISANARSLAGTFYALNAANGGASSARNLFPFRATFGIGSTPSSPGPMPGGAGSTSSITGDYPGFVGNGFAGVLRLGPVGPDGSFSGRIDGPNYNGAPLSHGHFASGTGTLVFVRMYNGMPFQVFAGTAYPSAPIHLSGSFYPLSAAGGASPARLQFPWSTGAAPQSSSTVVVATSSPGDVVRATRTLACDDPVVRVFYGATGSHVDVARGVAKAIRISQQPSGATVRNVRWECRRPGRTDFEIEQATCPGDGPQGRGSNVARISRNHDGDTSLSCIYRPGG